MDAIYSTIAASAATAIASYIVFRMKKRFEQVRQTQENVVSQLRQTQENVGTQLNQFAGRMEAIFNTNKETLESAIKLLFNRFEASMNDMTAQRTQHNTAIANLLASQERMIDSLETRLATETDRADGERAKRDKFSNLNLEFCDIAEDSLNRAAQENPEVHRLQHRLRDAKNARDLLLAAQLGHDLDN